VGRRRPAGDLMDLLFWRAEERPYSSTAGGATLAV
jgi:hypothetical protein